MNPTAAWPTDAQAAIGLVATHSLVVTIVGPSEALLAGLPAFVRLPVGIDPAALDDAVDPLASLAAGAPVRRPGLISRLAGRVLVVGHADRLDPALAAALAEAIDRGRLGGVVLIDGGDGIAPMLAERAAMMVFAEAPELPADHDTTPLADPAAAFAGAAAALGIASSRPPISALRVAAALATARGADAIGACDAERAARLCLMPRARTLPPPPPEAVDVPEQRDGVGGEDSEGERLVEAARVALPSGLLDGASATRGTGGGVLARRGAAARGRPGRVRRGVPGRDGRLDLVASLVAAAPMQRVRGQIPGTAPTLRKGDLHIRRPIPRARHLTVFALDASGSAAAARLAEVKGAVERLLGESYVRRDEVALVAFRGTAAQTLLPPTRAVARARRELAGLPGGGGTPMAAGIAGGLAEAVRARASGRATLLVLLTDGGSNIARDGRADRPAAAADARAAAQAVAAAGVSALVIDASARGSAEVRGLAEAMRGRYLALPRLDDGAIANAVAAAR